MTIAKRRHNKTTEDYGFDEMSVKELQEEMRSRQGKHRTMQEKILHRLLRMQSIRHSDGKEREEKQNEEPKLKYSDRLKEKIFNAHRSRDMANGNSASR